MRVPMYSADLIQELEKIYPDIFELDLDITTPAYWKQAGVIELIRNLKASIQININKEV